MQIKRGKGLSISFNLEAASKAAEDEYIRKEIVRLLTDRSIGFEELVWKVRKLYIRAGLPEGPGPEGLVRWLEKL